MNAERATLTWEEAADIDWGTVILFGGGLSLGQLFFDTKLAETIGAALLAGLGITGQLGVAGLSSAITAPLAAAYALQDTLGRGRDVRVPLARAVIGSTLAVGVLVTLIGTRPVALILVAQALNGLILPIVAVVLLLAMNDRRRLGNQVNGWRANLAGGIVVLLCATLGIRGMVGAFAGP